MKKKEKNKYRLKEKNFAIIYGKHAQEMKGWPRKLVLAIKLLFYTAEASFLSSDFPIAKVLKKSYVSLIVVSAKRRRTKSISDIPLSPNILLHTTVHCSIARTLWEKRVVTGRGCLVHYKNVPRISRAPFFVITIRSSFDYYFTRTEHRSAKRGSCIITSAR